MSETPYVETEVLLAVLNEDHAQAATLLRSLHRGELEDFLRTLHDVEFLVQACRASAVDSSAEA